MARLAEALGVPGGDPARALWDVAAASGVPTSLAALGLGADDLPEAAARAAAEITANPMPVDADALLGLLRRAFAGDPRSSQSVPRPRRPLIAARSLALTRSQRQTAPRGLMLQRRV